MGTLTALFVNGVVMLGMSGSLESNRYSVRHKAEIAMAKMPITSVIGVYALHGRSSDVDRVVNSWIDHKFSMPVLVPSFYYCLTADIDCAGCLFKNEPVMFCFIARLYGLASWGYPFMFEINPPYNYEYLDAIGIIRLRYKTLEWEPTRKVYRIPFTTIAFRL